MGDRLVSWMRAMWILYLFKKLFISVCLFLIPLVLNWRMFILLLCMSGVCWIFLGQAGQLRGGEGCLGVGEETHRGWAQVWQPGHWTAPWLRWIFFSQ